MKITYTPEGAEPRVWDFKPGKLMNAEAEVIERHTDWTYQQFGVKFMEGSTLAYHAVLFVMLKRSIPTLKWDDVQFCLDEVQVEFTEDENVALMKAMRADRADLTDDQAKALEALEAEFGHLADDAPKEVTTEQDVPAPSSD